MNDVRIIHELTTNLYTSSHLRQEALVEVADDSVELLFQFLGQLSLPLDSLESLILVRLEVSQQISLPLENLVDGDSIKETVDTSEDEWNHLLDSHRVILLLLQELGQTLTTSKSLLSGSIQVRTELSEGSNFTVLSQEELEGTSDLLHGLELCRGSNTGDRETDVDSGTNTLVEQLCFQENLAISDGDDIGRNVGRHITTLGFNNRKGSERTTLVLVIQLSRTLKKTGVKIEDTKKQC